MKEMKGFLSKWWLMSGVLGMGLLGGTGLRADSYTGQTWAVRFNQPDQSTAVSSAKPEEFLIRDRWISRLNAMEAGDWACLSTYTFSGPSLKVGAAGPILVAVSNALARGVKVGFVTDYNVNVSSNFATGCSLTSLARRAGNALQLSVSPKGGIMHNKLGVFWDASAREGWVISGSWNFTGGASSQQWNILTEIQNAALVTACSNELSQLLAGHFHADATKSHAWDGATFVLESNRTGWVRFSPYPDGKYGGNNALTDITNRIAAARDEIFFGLNKLTRQGVAAELVKACNRGVVVHGVVPKSDCGSASGDSYAVCEFLRCPTNYTTDNRVRLYEAYTSVAHTSYDNFNRDLVHAKYMLIDPRGAEPWVIQGSANWTASALVQTASNDENVQFIPHAGMARALMNQFALMSDGMLPWCELVPGMVNGGLCLDLKYWIPSDGSWVVAVSDDVNAPERWQVEEDVGLPSTRGLGRVGVSIGGARKFFRIQSP